MPIAVVLVLHPSIFVPTARRRRIDVALFLAIGDGPTDKPTDHSGGNAPRYGRSGIVVVMMGPGERRIGRCKETADRDGGCNYRKNGLSHVVHPNYCYPCVVFNRLAATTCPGGTRISPQFVPSQLRQGSARTTQAIACRAKDTFFGTRFLPVSFLC